MRKLEALIADALTYDEQRQLVIDSTGVGIWDWNVQTGSTSFNERWAEIIGYSLDELAPLSIETWLEHAFAEDLPGSREQLEATWRGDTDLYVFESRMHHKNGDLVWVLDTGKVVEWVEPGVPRRMIGTHIDITRLKQHNQQLEQARQQAEDALAQLADMNLELQSEVARRKQAEQGLRRRVMTDHLTQLPNRLALEEYFLTSIKELGQDDGQLTIIYLDLDDFKKLDYRYGHSVGDAVLVELSLILQELTRDRGLAGRLAGDDFVIVLPAVMQSGSLSELLGELTRRFPAELTCVDSPDLKLRGGIARFPEHGASFGELCGHAEQAMYQVGKGTGGFCFYPDMRVTRI